MTRTKSVTQRRRPRNKAWKNKRKRLWRKQGGKCHYCGTATVEPSSGGAADDWATLDHLVPMSEGGSHDESNLVMACYRCNQRRNDERNMSSNIKAAHVVVGCNLREAA